METHKSPLESMFGTHDYKRFAVLYVDDEEMSLKGFVREFKDRLRVMAAPNAAEAYRIVETNPEDIGLILTDQRMPGEQGVQLLERVRQLRPRIIRILVTAYADVDSAIAAVNTGAIYKYITKPWDVPMLEVTLKRGLEYFMLQRERDYLLNEKMSALHKLVITDRVISLGVLAAGLGNHMRNAMVAVQTFLELAPEMLSREQVDMGELRHPDFWHSFYEMVQQRVKRVVQSLDCLNLAAEFPRTEFEADVSLAEVVETAWCKTRTDLEARRIAFTSDVPADLPRLLVDQRRFERLFLFLLRDEAISLPEGSKVTLRATAKPDSNPNNPEIEISLEDDGPGLPEDAVRSLFDPFFKRGEDPQEFGLNLMACYFIVYHHGGRMDVKNRPGHGVRFVITLPTDPRQSGNRDADQDFMTKVIMNDRLWERLLATA